MLRKTLVTLVSVAVLGLGSAAMAGHSSGGGGGGGGRSGGAGIGGGAGLGGAGLGTMSRSARPLMLNGGNTGPIRSGPMVTAPMTAGRWNGSMAWHNHFHDHFHHRFHNRNFFAFGFGGPIYDYASSCWSWVPTRYGWQRVYVCGDDYGY